MKANSAESGNVTFTTYTSFCAALRMAFLWDRTPQGHQYWADVYRKHQSPDDNFLTKPVDHETA
jgi:hypothetical protein